MFAFNAVCINYIGLPVGGFCFIHPIIESPKINLLNSFQSELS
jgi:hypothetical protein